MSDRLFLLIECEGSIKYYCLYFLSKEGIIHSHLLCFTVLIKSTIPDNCMHKGEKIKLLLCVCVW